MVKEVLKVSPETGGAYEAPQCEVMELQMEGVLLSGSSGDKPGWPDHSEGGHEEAGDDSNRFEKR